MADPQLTQEWIDKADAEKYLKAFIIAHDLEFLKIHDLPVLLKTCLKKTPL